MNNYPSPINSSNTGRYDYYSPGPYLAKPFVSPQTPFSSGNPSRDAYLNSAAERLSQGHEPPRYIDGYWQERYFPQHTGKDLFASKGFPQDPRPNLVFERHLPSSSAQNRASLFAHRSSETPRLISSGKVLSEESKPSKNLNVQSAIDFHTITSAGMNPIPSVQDREHLSIVPSIEVSSFIPKMPKVEGTIVPIAVPLPSMKIQNDPIDKSSFFSSMRWKDDIEPSFSGLISCPPSSQPSSSFFVRQTLKRSIFPQKGPDRMSLWLDQQNEKFLQWQISTTTVSPSTHFSSHRDDLRCFQNSLQESMEVAYAKDPYFKSTVFIDITQHGLSKRDGQSRWTAFPQESLERITPFSLTEFSKGFAKGLSKGMYDSGKGLATFATDLVLHPLDTGRQMRDAFLLFSQLIHSKEWEALSRALSPEAHRLIREWDELAPRIKGELTGYVLGKHGADILIPGAFVKIGGKGIQTAREMTVLARGTFAFEAAAMRNRATIDAFARASTEISFNDRCFKKIKEVNAIQKINNLKSSNILEIDRGTSFFGSKRMPLDYAPYQKSRNSSTIINERAYVGHALDRMQDRGLTPLCIEEAIKNGVKEPNKIKGRMQFYSPENKIVVVTEENTVVTIFF